MQTRITVPLDGSTLGRRAIPVALALARRSDATVELVHVHARAPVAAGAPAFDTRLDDEERARMRTELNDLASQLAGETGLEVVARFLDGEVISSLRRYLMTSDASLIVMMTHGRGGPRRFWLGSVAEKLVRDAPVPVLLPRAGAEWSGELREPLFSRVLVPLDDSDVSEEILTHVLSLATPRETTLVLLSVVHPGLALRASAVDLRPGSSTDETLLESVRRTTVERLTRLAAELRANCVGVESVVLVDAHPAQCIVRYAEAHHIDLIALATHGRGILGSVLLGATADKVIRTAQTSLLVYRPPASEMRFTSVTPL